MRSAPRQAPHAMRASGIQEHGGPGLAHFLRRLLSIMTVADRILFFALLGIGVLSIFGVRLLLAPGRTATVSVNNRPVARLSLAAAGTHTINGMLGPVELRVNGHAVLVFRSRCPEKICIRQGAISRRGEIIVCVPNRMVVSIDGEAENSLDAITP